MGIAYNPKIVTSGLVLCLDAANTKSYPGSGTTWTDLSGNGYSGTLVDGPTYTSNNGGSLVFDGLNDRVHLVSPSNRWEWTPSGSGLNSMTIEFFVKSTDNSGQYISKPWNGNGEYNWRINSAIFFTTIGNQSHSLNFASMASENWQHICAVINPTQKALYRNGVIYANFANHNITNNTPANGNNSAPVCLMSLYPYGSGWAGDTTHAIAGNLATLRIYNRVLSAAEIAQNFQATRGRYGI